MRKYANYLQVYSVSIQLKDYKISHLPVQVNANGKIEGVPGLVPSAGPPNTCSQEEGIKLCGTIKIVDPFTRELFIYNRAKENPEFVNVNDTISLMGHSEWCPRASNVQVCFDLKDADQGREISRGFLNFVEWMFSCPPCYFDRRLSAVIHGDHGSATLYYSLFKHAIEATTAIKLFVKRDHIGCSSSCVYGSIYVRYGGHDYQQDYQKKHYRIVLFNRSASNGIPLDDDNFIPLSIPMVAAPADTPLIIEAELHVMCCGSEIAGVCSEAEFSEPEELSTLAVQI